ncbi:MAG TPA: PAS domain S-box protein [Candidatus Udaeobacter sp.]|nr:PAS domain S-box protein [Candidatus Udaeobacter sp.]
MKSKKASASKRAFRDGAGGTRQSNVALAKSKRRPLFRQPKTELEQAAQRYVDLFDFAPIGYVTFDRVGRIEEVNFAAEQLLGRSRRQLIGITFAVCVGKEDTQRFLNHLLECRALDGPVVTELCLNGKDGKRIPVLLSSTATITMMKDGAHMFHTAIVDLSERKRFEDQIQQSEKRYRALFDLVPVAIYVCDADGIIREYNQRAVELWGAEPGGNGNGPKFCGSHKIYHPDGRRMPHEECPMARALRGEKLSPKDLEIVVEQPNGERRHVIPAPSILTDDRGKITGAINCLFDISDYKRAELAALRLAAVVQSSRDAIATKNLNGIITDWNQSAQRIFGYKPKEIIGKSVLTLIPKERQREEQKILRTIRRGESLDHYETVRRRKDGKLINVSLTISPIKGPNGDIIGVSKIARDITKQKQTERRLAEQARLLDLSSDAILVRDSSHRIVYWNSGATELYGYSKKEAEGKVSHELLRTEHPEALRNISAKLRRDNRWSGELVHTRKNGTKITVSSRWVLDRDARGKPISVLETNTDITARKRAELALRRSKEVLEETVDQRTQELRVANTELKNEIERRKGLEGEILTISDREQQRLGQELHDGLCQHLTAVAFMTRSIALRLKNHRVIEVDDIDKIAQLVNDAATDTRNLSRALHRLDVDAAGLVDALQDLVDREIWRTPCRLEVKPSFRIDNDAAAAHLYRIAREAVINANKHAQAREVVIKLERSRREMVLHVLDDGIGLSTDPKLKQGLGLHIMMYRSKLAGGRLEIDSPKNRGTRVSCYLPDGLLESRRSDGKENGEPPKFSRRQQGSPSLAV